MTGGRTDGARLTASRAVAATVAATVVASMPVFLLGGLAVLVREDLAFGEVQLGLAVTTFFTVAAVTSVPAARALARAGSGRMLLLSGGGSAAALVVMAVAPSYPVLLVALAIAGGANSMAQISCNQAVAHLVPPERQGVAFGAKQAAIPASTLLAGLALPVLGLTIGWRATFLVAAASAVAMVVLVRLPAAREPKAQPGAGRVRRAPRRTLVVLAVAAALAAGAANSLGAFLVASAVAVGVTPASAGLLLSSGSAVGLVMRLTVGWLADRRVGGHLAVVASMLAGGSLGLAVLTASSPALLVVGTAVAFGLGWSWPGLLTFAVVRLHPTAPAAATSITQSGVFVGGAVGPLLFGVLVETASYRVAWTGAACALLAAAALVTVAQRRVSAVTATAAG